MSDILDLEGTCYDAAYCVETLIKELEDKYKESNFFSFKLELGKAVCSLLA